MNHTNTIFRELLKIKLGLYAPHQLNPPDPGFTNTVSNFI